MAHQTKLHPLIPPFLLLAVALSVYANGLHNDFQGDDVGRVVQLEPIGGPGKFHPQYALRDGLLPLLKTVLPDRPFLMVTIWLNYLAGGADPFSYRLVNVLLHALTALILYHLCLHFSRREGAPARPLAALAAAALFTVHPLHSQTMNVVIQRGAILAALFTLLGFLFFLKFRESKNRALLLASTLMLLLGVLSKQFAVILPIIIGAYLVVVERSPRDLRLLRAYLPVLIIPALFYFGFGDSFQHLGTNTLGRAMYLEVQAHVVLEYFRQIIFPLPMHILYTYDGLPTALVIGAHLLIFSALFFLARKQRPILFCLFAFYLCLVPESSIFPIAHIGFDHRLYLPLAFLMLLAYAFISRLPARPLRLLLLAIALIIPIFGALTMDRNRALATFEYRCLLGWRDTLTDRGHNRVCLVALLMYEHFERGQQVASLLTSRITHYKYAELMKNAFARKQEAGTYLEKELMQATPAISEEEHLELIYYIIRRKAGALKGLTLTESLEKFLASQLPIFLRFPQTYGPYLTSYIDLNRSLIEHFRRAALQNSLTPSQSEYLLALAETAQRNFGAQAASLLDGLPQSPRLLAELERRNRHKPTTRLGK